MTRLEKFLALPWGRKLLVAKCWVMLNGTAIALRVISLPTLIRSLGTNTPVGYAGITTDRDAILWSVRAAAALSWRPTCAVRGLVVERLLRRAGIEAQFRVGVARQNEDFQAHAWVESREGILVGASEREYQPLPKLTAEKLPARP